MNKEQLIKELNYHFPSYEASRGDGFADDSILFMGENAASNLLQHDLGNGTCPVNTFLECHGWYVEHYDEITALAYQDTDFKQSGEIK